MYLTLKALLCNLLHLFIYVDVSLFHWLYFTSFFDHYYIEQNICFFIWKQLLEDLTQNSRSKSVLNQLKDACGSVSFLLKLQATVQQVY